jgi:GntR family transcriptional regulator, transcriptional repressor for pyruvate dehydrogenase complex
VVKQSRPRIVDEVLPALRDRALGLEVGQQMPTESQIVEGYGVSRQTAREALAALRAEGHIEIKHGVGAFVIDKTETDRMRFQDWFRSNRFEISELIEMRAAIEPFVAELAAERITEEELARLRESAEGFEAILLGDDVEAKVTADESFHGIILEASRNSGLRMFYESFMPGLRDYRAHVFSPPADPLLALPHHRRIYEAIAAHDAVLAGQHMRAHIDHSRLDVRRLAELDNLTA